MSNSTEGVGAAAIPDMVIAKFAPGPMCFSFAATAAIWVLGWMALLGDTSLEQAWIMDKAQIAMLFLYTLFILWAFVTVLRQMIYHGGRAIWIENGRLRYTAHGTLPFSSMPLGDIQDVSIVRGFLRPTRIAIRAKDRADYMVTLFLSIPADAIRARLVGILSQAGVRVGEAPSSTS